MKISLELQSMLKSNSKSGVGWYTYELIKRLENEDLDLQGCVFNFLNRNDIISDVRKFNFNIEICTLIPYSVYSKLWSYIPIKYNTLFKSRADIYHFFNFVVPPRIDGKVIVTIYDMVYKTFPQTMSKTNYKRLHNNLRRSTDRANVIITISENSKKEIMEYLKIPSDKIYIVPPGVEIELYNKKYNESEKDIVRLKYNLPHKFILYLGTLEPRKNIESIIDSFALYKIRYKDDLKLVIAGNKGWMYESIFKKVRSYKLENEVVFTGYVEEVDKPIIYKCSRIFMFPSLYEGFGMPPLEAMAAGVPVIASNTSSLPEVCGEAAILIKPNDIVGMCESIFKLQNDLNIRHNLVINGYKQCEKYTWNNSLKALINVYQMLYNGR